MSTRPPNNTTGPFDHLSLRYLRQALGTSHPVDEPYVLSEVESQGIRRTKVVTVSLVVLVSLLGVSLFYWPQQFWPALFITTPIQLLGWQFDLPLVAILFGILLVYVEVNVLLWLNIWGVHMIMEICQFPRIHDARYDQNLQSIADAGGVKNRLNLLRTDVDSYLSMPRWGLFFFFLQTALKAFLSSLALNTLITWFWGSHTLKHLTDFVGMPAYTLWNIWASWQVLHEAQVRVMAPSTIREFVDELHVELGKESEIRPLIVQAMHYINLPARQHNYAHFLLTVNLIETFDLPNLDAKDTEFIQRLQQAPEPVKRGIGRLLVFGSLVDGNLSGFEKRRLNVLRQKNLIPYTNSDLRTISRDYNQGQGLWV